MPGDFNAEIIEHYVNFCCAVSVNSFFNLVLIYTYSFPQIYNAILLCVVIYFFIVGIISDDLLNNKELAGLKARKIFWQQNTAFQLFVSTRRF